MDRDIILRKEAEETKMTIFNKVNTSWGMVGASAALLAFSMGTLVGQHFSNKVIYVPQVVSAAPSQAPPPQPAQGTPSQPVVQTTSPATPFKDTGNALFDVGAKPVPEAQWGAYEQIPVKDSNGKITYLSAFHHPVMFMAYWCPHCQRTLSAFQQDGIGVKPDLISVQWNTTPNGIQMLSLDQTETLTTGDFNSLSFQPSGYRVFYEGDSNVVNQLAPQGFPTIVFGYRGQLYQVIGELPTPGAWGELFSAKNAAQFTN